MKNAPMIVVFVLLVLGVLWLAVRNYGECREHFSAFYCLTTHFLK